MSKQVTKFKFDIKFQEDILRYIATDDYGHKALRLIKPEYFDLVEHTVIATVLKNSFRKDKKVIKNPNVLNEQIKVFLKNPKYRKLVTDADIKSVLGLIDKLYTKVKDGNYIYESCQRFAQYVELKGTLEDVNLEDFNEYENYATRIKKAITTGNDLNDSKGLFLFKDIKDRHHNRKFRDNLFEFPLRQLNRLTNGNGYQKGSIIVVLDKEKALKTTTLVNIARKYAKRKKKVIIFDLENGEEQYGERLEQSVMNIDKMTLLSGNYDAKTEKAFRNFQRLGIELVVKKLPAYSTTADTLRYWLDYYYSEHGIRFEYMIIDYIGKMGAISGTTDETQRISDAYVDVDNLANDYNIIHTWTGHHVKRDAYQRRRSKYMDSDTAKCIDINRHVSMMLGIQQNAEEHEQGIIRLEVIVQRDGPPEGRVWLAVNPAHQRIDELNKTQVEELEAAIKENYNPAGNTEQKKPKKTTGDL